MGPIEIIIVVVCVLAVVGTIAAAILRKKKNKSSCGCSCGQCSGCPLSQKHAQPNKDTKINEQDL